MMDKIFSVIDKIVTIVLIVCVTAFIVKLIMEIGIMTKLKYPGECITVNDEYYCKVVKSKKDISVKM